MVGKAVEVEISESETRPGVIKEVYEPHSDEIRVIVNVDGRDTLRDTSSDRVVVVN